MSSNPLKKCPSCKKAKLERLIGTGAGVIFKGSGFYQTDYRGDAYKNDAKKDTEAASKSGGDSKQSGDSKSGGDGKQSGGGKSGGDGKQSGGGSDAPSGGSIPKQD